MKTQYINRYNGAGIGYGPRLLQLNKGQIKFNNSENVPGVGAYNLKSDFGRKLFEKEPIN